MIKKYALIVVPIAVVIGLGAFFILRPHQNRALDIGDSALDFTLPLFRATRPPAGSHAVMPANLDPASTRFRLSDYRHHVVLVNFWATWCPPCIEEAPSLQRFAEQVRQDGAIVIGLSVDQDADALAKFLARFQISFPIARDPDQVLAHRYGTFQFPETYILDRDGRVAEKIIGGIDWQDPRILEYVRALAHPNERAAR